MDEKQVIYKPFEDMSFTYNKCFLCGILLGDADTKEHLFPKWLLRRYNLWDAEIVLLNKMRLFRPISFSKRLILVKSSISIPPKYN